MFRFVDANGQFLTGRFADYSYKTGVILISRTIEAWNGRDLGYVRNFQWLARGGIVTSPTAAVVGEAGPEAVLPLNRGAGLGGLGLTLNVNVPGNTFGESLARDPEAMFREFAEKIAYEVRRVIADEHRPAKGFLRSQCF